MPLADKVKAAHQINDLLKTLLADGRFRLKYRITVEPQLPADQEWERPEVLVEFAGPDSSLLLDRGAELLRAFEALCQENLRLGPGEHNLVVFDCQNHRAGRLQELRTAATVAAEKVRKSGMPYQFAPMNSRERRILHLALRDHGDLRTESNGMGPSRSVVLYPKDYKGAPPQPAMTRGRR